MDGKGDQSIDLRGTPCPLNWVKAKLRLETIAPGQRLEVLLDEGDPIRNVSRSVKAEGHRILKAMPSDGYVALLVERAAPGG